MIPLFSVNVPKDVDAPMLEVLHSGYIGQGPKVEQFEAALSKFFGTKNVLTLNSATSGLHLALRLAGVEPGDEVISTPMTCSATNEPILATGALPVWADVDPVTGLIDPLDVARKITLRTKAIVCVDWGGTPCDLDELMAIGQRYGVKVIEDAAHALGATYKGKTVGTIADFTVFSFQAIKHITTVDGGALCCKDTYDYRRGKLLRWYGIDRETDRKDSRIEEDIVEWGYKFHMNDVAATIGLASLPHAGEIIEEHRANARYYLDHIDASVYGLPEVAYESESAYWLFTLVLPTPKDRSAFIRFMTDQGIHVSPVHARNDTHTVFLPFAKTLPGVTSFASREVAIPVHSKLTKTDRERIAACCNAFAKSL